ncbi:MAG TPA: hypothetical protein PK636_06330, partial [bacterium]|nr:hypothetical protein [bacterium]
MRDSRKTGIVLVYGLVDLVCIFFSFYLPYLLRYADNPYVRSLSLPDKWLRLGDWALGPYTLVFFIWAVLCVLFLNHYRLYRTDRGLGYLDELLLVARAVLLASLSAAGAIFLLQVKIYSRMVFGLNVALLFATLAGWRWAKRWLVRRRVSRGFNNRNVLIAGSGRLGVELARLVAANRHLGLELVGYLGDGAPAAALPAPVLGRLDEVESVIRKYFVDEVLVALDPREERFPELVHRARRLGVGVMVTPGVLGADPADVRVNYLGRVPLLEYQEKGL